MKDASLDIFSFADSFVEKRPAAEETRLTTDGMLEITKRCSLRCSHCYIGDARWKPEPEISTKSLLELLDHLAERGTLWLSFTGGEPLLHKDFEKIWRYANQKGFLIQLLTNATLFTEEHLALFQECPPYRIEVSVYGTTKESYERLAQTPGSFSRFLAGLSIIQKLGVNWLMKAPLVKGNIEEKNALQAFADSYGVPIYFNGLIFASTGQGKTGGQAPCSTRADEKSIAAVEIQNPADFEVLKNNSYKREDRLYDCGAGKNEFFVSAKGDVQMCNLTVNRSYRLQEGAIAESFSKAWDAFGEVRNIPLSSESPCHACDLRAICRLCPGIAVLETGQEDATVEWVCRQTHEKARLLDMPHQCSPKHYVHKK